MANSALWRLHANLFPTSQNFGNRGVHKQIILCINVMRTFLDVDVAGSKIPQDYLGHSQKQRRSDPGLIRTDMIFPTKLILELKKWKLACLIGKAGISSSGYSGTICGVSYPLNFF